MNKDFSSKKRYHEQNKFCYKRPAYREAKWERAVKVYTINQESKYLLVQGVPSVGVCKELIELFAIYGAIEEYRYLDEYPAEEFTDVYWIKFQKIQSARFAKKKLDMRSFYGGVLHVCYAPEFETVDDTREKLKERRQVIARKCKEYFLEQSKRDIEEAKPNEKLSAGLVSTITTPEGFSKPNESFVAVPCQTSSTQFNSNNVFHPNFDYPLGNSDNPPTYPALPLPPMNLPPLFYPPPPPPPPQEFPRVPTKNATLPRNLQLNVDTATVAHPSPPLPAEKSTAKCSLESLSTKLPNESQRKPDAKSDNQKRHKEKRIVWHTQPNALLPSVAVQDRAMPEPGAWDPYAEKRKELKSVTGDQKLDQVTLQIREKLKRVSETGVHENVTTEKDQESAEEKIQAARKKARKRI